MSVSVTFREAWRGRIASLLVYTGSTSTDLPQISIPAAEFRKLSDQDLRALHVADQAFRDRQIERLARFGRSYAYGVFVDGTLAHVSWLLPAEAVRRENPVVLKLGGDEAEITACETMPEFRGKGIYGFAIRRLFAVARECGVRRIYMKTTWGNKASQRGIRSAGLERAGVALLFVPPLFSGRTCVVRLYR
jgi:hypothetical protein